MTTLRNGYNRWGRAFGLLTVTIFLALALSLALPQAAWAAASWTVTGSMVTARDSHTATLLPNGQVLVVGGLNSNNGVIYLSSAELYNPATGTWSPTAALTTARKSHTATLLPNGKVLVAGGSFNSNPVASAELYDPATGTWTRHRVPERGPRLSHRHPPGQRPGPGGGGL